MSSLSLDSLRAAAGDLVFARGEDYFRWVVGLRVEGDSAHGTIQAKNVYLVELDWSGGGPAGSCTCPHNADGFFCKHLVAVGLAVLDAAGPVAVPGVADIVDTLLDNLTGPEVRDLVRELADRDAGARRLIEVRAAALTGDATMVVDDLVALTNAALRSRGFIDYRRSFEVAREAEELLDELDQHLRGGLADAVRPALLRALTRLRKITQYADDSGGVIGDACQRAADLYARSCREGSPDGLKLARWLAKFRDESPGFPVTELADFAPAFDAKALAAYRKAADALDRKHAGEDQWKRSEVERMLLELADHDGDVDRAVELLSRHEHKSYGGIVRRLRDAGREEEAVTWIDRAVAEGRLASNQQGGEFWLVSEDVARVYVGLGRHDDAIAVLRSQFSQRPGLATYRALLDLAATLDREEGERDWALAHARAKAGEQFGTGAALIEIHVGLGDLDAAWEAATKFGPGYEWERLAKASKEARPVDAARLYRPHVDKDLSYADTRKYPKIATMLTAMRDLYLRGGAAAEFEEYLSSIRETYRRRTSLMAALDRKGL